jgi:poly(glycerol-phosphate) alpha-glucosyltransferase
MERDVMSPTSVHLVINSLALRRGGLVNAVLRRANVLAASGEVGEVWIEVLSPQPWLDHDVSFLKSSGRLHSDVNVRSVLRVLDPSTYRDARNRRPEPALPEGSRITVDTTTTEVVDDGVLRAVERRDSAGRVRQIDRYSIAAVRKSRAEFDPHGHLSRILDYTGVGELGAERLIGRDGRTYLTIHHAGGSPKWTRVYLGSDQVFLSGSIGEVYVRAFNSALADFEAPIVFSEFRENLNNLPDWNLDRIVSSISHPNLRQVAVAHSNHFARPYVPGAAATRFWQALLKQAHEWDEFVVWTEQQRQDLRDEYHPDVPICAIPQYAPPLTPPSGPPDQNKVLLVSRLHPKKRVDEAMRVMRVVADKLPEARLVAYGFGYGDKEERRIRDLVDELDLDANLVFAGFAEDSTEIYGDAAVTLMTSQSEGFSQVILESFSYGVPVVSYDCRYGPRDVIADGGNGYIHEFGDSVAAAESIVKILTNPDLRERLSKEALSTAARFSPKLFEERWVKLCHDVAARPPRSSAVGVSPDGADPPAPSGKPTVRRVARRIRTAVRRKMRR